MSKQNRKNEYNRLIKEGRTDLMPEVLIKEFGAVPKPKAEKKVEATPSAEATLEKPKKEKVK